MTSCCIGGIGVLKAEILLIRQEEKSDVQAIAKLLDTAFGGSEESAIVAGLRDSDWWLPELVLVAEDNNELTAFAMISRIELKNSESTGTGFALGPIATIPREQNQGVGTALIKELLSRFDAKYAAPLLVLGAPKLYSRFGFDGAHKVGIYPPVPWDAEHFMVRDNGAKIAKQANDSQNRIAFYPDAWKAAPNLSEVTLRVADVDDNAIIARLYAISCRYELPSLPNLHSAEEDVEFFGSKVLIEQVWVAQDADGTLVGFVSFARGLVSHLWILPQAQRHGIGKRLLQKAMDATDTVELWTFQCNQNARAFYRKMGFVETKLTDGAGNEEKEPDVLLRWTR